MAALISIDRPESGELRTDKDGAAGDRRLAIVGDLSGDALSCQDQALNCPGVPGDGEFHPRQPDLIVTGRSVRYLGAGRAEVTIDYNRDASAHLSLDDPAAIAVEFDATVESVSARRDVHGALLTVTHKPAGAAQGHTIVAEAPMLRPRTLLRVRSYESKPPFEEAAQYVARVNTAGGFIVPALQTAEGTWLYTSLRATSQDLGATWDKTREFLYNGAGWNKTSVVYHDETGRPPPGILGLGGEVLEEDAVLQDVELYETINLGGLLTG